MVLPVAVISPAGFFGSSPSPPFMPSLNPLTAPPRSAPMLRSFFVPKMSSTMSSTINQCQMLNEPIVFAPGSRPRETRPSGGGRGWEHGPEWMGAADDVYVKMIHVLPADSPGVDDGAEAVGRSLLAREPGGDGQHAAQHRRVLGPAVSERIDVRFRDDHEVDRGLRIDVVEGEHVVVFVDFLARDLARDDLAENAVFHRASYFGRAAFSSRPERPSRRSSSPSTSCSGTPCQASITRQ